MTAILSVLPIIVGLIFTPIIIGAVVFCIWKLISIQKKNIVDTNTDSMIGQVFLLKKSCNGYDTGIIRIGDVDWRVKSENSKDIQAGAFVKIVRLEGNVFFVKETTYGV